MLKKIIAIPALADNYIWTVIDEKQRAIVIDPGDADPVLQTLENLNLTLTTILLTHHHHDHSGGIKKLIEHNPTISVIGSKLSSCPLLTHHVQEGDVVDCGSFKLNVLEIPGHTLDHIAFYNEAVLFSGDTLFSAGCGKVFEGTYRQMYQSLQKLAQLPDDIKLYCGHEYTLSNLRFAQKVEPNNRAIDKAIQYALEMKNHNTPTLPSLLSQEKNINPFLRCAIPEVVLAAERHANKKLTTEDQVFTCLREWKNSGY